MGKPGWRSNRERCLIVNNSSDIPARLAEIVDDFQFAEGREKLEMLLQFSENLPPLPERYAGRLAEMEAVPECMTPVAIAVELIDGGLVYHFAVPEESPTVRGYAAICRRFAGGLTPAGHSASIRFLSTNGTAKCFNHTAFERHVRDGRPHKTAGSGKNDRISHSINKNFSGKYI